jgi:hypothetical protein
MKLKKYLVLGVLFLLPLSMYMFFASGKDNFGRLPTLTTNVAELNAFRGQTDDTLTFNGKITILGFLGEDPLANKVNAYNLAHKIYKKYRGFTDFQFVYLLPEGTQDQAKELRERIEEIAPADRWLFAFGSAQEIRSVFTSLNTDLLLKSDLSTPYVFIIDKNRNLRGRDDDEDLGILYGFDASDYAEINNKMDDDVKVLLAEYRLELKKYKADRQI